MPSYAEATVTAVLVERTGLQRVLVQRHPEIPVEQAYVLTNTIGAVAVGDRVIMNTTAVDLGLGTGGWHVVHWNLSQGAYSEKGPGHVMKARYTSVQSDVGVMEEHKAFAPKNDLKTRPVVACLLHSQVAAVAVAARTIKSDLRIAYVMTDQAALPLALSDLLFDLTNAGLIDVTITAGQAFGGHLEAVNVASALTVAVSSGAADLIIVGPGPGVVGTGTTLGFSELEIAHVLEDAARLGGFPILALRWSDADTRLRHRGLSHHSITVLRHTFAKAQLAIPAGVEVAAVGDHPMVPVPVPDLAALFKDHELDVTSMGRSIEEDPNFFAFAGAAGVLAASVAARL